MPNQISDRNCGVLLTLTGLVVLCIGCSAVSSVGAGCALIVGLVMVIFS
jgi:hypothetical protein